MKRSRFSDCSVCGEVETREIPKLVSEYDYVINDVTAEKTEDGISVAVNLTKASITAARLL